MNSLKDYQKDLEDSFLLDCGKDALKWCKDARKTSKVLKKQRKKIDGCYRLIERKSFFDVLNDIFLIF